MEKETKALAESVRRMTESGMSQREIAKALDISQSTVSRLTQYEPASEAGSLAAMMAAENERRAMRDEAYKAYHARERTVNA